MEPTEQTIYFCHPVFDYNEDFETNCIKEMKKEFGNRIKIINPHTDIKMSEEDRKKLSGSLDDYIQMLNKYFFPVIDNCDIVCVFTSDYQKYTDGVFREIQYATYRGKTVIEWWKKDRIKFYEESDVKQFIDNFFDVKKGVRCIAGHEKDMYRLKHQPSYRIWENNQCRAITIHDPISKKYDALVDYWCNHTFMYTFDKSILDWNDGLNSIPMFRDNRIGLNAVIDLDSPDDPGSNYAKRLTFFDYIDDFNNVINRIDKFLGDYTTDYNLQFSGNGIYINLEGYYGDDILEEDCARDMFINLLDNLREKQGLDNKLKVHVDNAGAPWNDFFKLPFTFHETKSRVSIPLPKGELDGEWINRVSNVNNITTDKSIVNEIIKKAKWDKIW